jgi:hypothetical protein
VTPGVGVEAEPELGLAAAAHPQVHGPREPALVLDREAVRRVVGPARRDDGRDPLDGVVLGVRRRDGRPRDRLGIDALLDDAGHVGGHVGPEGHHAVGQGRHLVGESHGASVTDTATGGDRFASVRIEAAPVGAVGQD